MKRYAIKSVFLTLQGEGARAGTKAVFVRFVGCNAWDGSPEHRDRGTAACSRWCDSDFRKEGSEMLTAAEVGERCAALWPRGAGENENRERWVVLTGGEPLLQVDEAFIDGLNGWSVAVETNGSVAINDAPAVIDHVTISPKRGLALHPSWLRQDGNAVARCHELKVVLPGEVDGEGWTDAELLDLKRQLDPDHCFVQPMDAIDPAWVEVSHLHRNASHTAGAHRPSQLSLDHARHVERCVAFVLAHPEWRVSVQAHKYLGLL